MLRDTVQPPNSVQTRVWCEYPAGPSKGKPLSELYVYHAYYDPQMMPREFSRERGSGASTDKLRLSSGKRGSGQEILEGKPCPYGTQRQNSGRKTVNSDATRTRSLFSALRPATNYKLYESPPNPHKYDAAQSCCVALSHPLKEVGCSWFAGASGPVCV